MKRFIDRSVGAYFFGPSCTYVSSDTQQRRPSRPTFRIFSSAGWAFHISWSNVVCLCLDVNQGDTNRNCCTQRLVILRAQTYWWTLIAHQKLDHCDLLYGSKSPAEKKWAWLGMLQRAERHSPWAVSSISKSLLFQSKLHQPQPQCKNRMKLSSLVIRTWSTS